MSTNTSHLVYKALDESRKAVLEQRIKDLDGPHGSSQDYIDAAAMPSESGSPVKWLVIVPVAVVVLLAAMWFMAGGVL